MALPQALASVRKTLTTRSQAVRRDLSEATASTVVAAPRRKDMLGQSHSSIPKKGLGELPG